VEAFFRDTGLGFGDCEPGVLLGNHTWSHPHSSEPFEATFVREIQRTEHYIRAAYNRPDATRPPKLFRFPYETLR